MKISFSLSRLVLKMASNFRASNPPSNLDPLKLAGKLRMLQASVVTIKDEMRRFQEEKESQLSSVSDRINDILNLLVENSASALPASANGFKTEPLKSSLYSQSASANGFKSEPLKSTGYKREASTEAGNGDYQRAPKMGRTEGYSHYSVGGGQEYQVNSEGFTEVHTDGACPNNGKGSAKAGIGVWWGHHHKLNVGRPVVRAKQTNNAAEIQAASVAISTAVDNGIAKLLINTDSQFLINCVTQWMDGWKKNGWMTKSKQPVKNRDDLEELDQAINSGRIQVKWNHVKGHSGIEGNEEADKLAVKGAQMQQ